MDKLGQLTVSKQKSRRLWHHVYR